MPRGVPARFLEISTLKELDGLLGTQAFFGAQKIQGGPAFPCLGTQNLDKGFLGP